MNCSSPGQVAQCIFHTYSDDFEGQSNLGCALRSTTVVNWVRKLFGFPRGNTGEFGVNMSSLDKVLANIWTSWWVGGQRCHSQLQQSLAWSCPGWGEILGRAQHSLQLVGDEQRVLCMFLGKDVVNSVASAWKLQLMQGYADKFALNQCFQGDRHPVSACNPHIIQYHLPRPQRGLPPRPLWFECRWRCVSFCLLFTSGGCGALSSVGSGPGFCRWAPCCPPRCCWFRGLPPFSVGVSWCRPRAAGAQ